RDARKATRGGSPLPSDTGQMSRCELWLSRGSGGLATCGRCRNMKRPARDVKAEIRQYFPPKGMPGRIGKLNLLCCGNRAAASEKALRLDFRRQQRYCRQIGKVR